MKHVRFFIGATIVAMTFLACNKEDTKPVDGPMKFVEIDLANILTSRSAGTAIADGAPVTLKDCQISSLTVQPFTKVRMLTLRMRFSSFQEVPSLPLR